MTDEELDYVESRLYRGFGVEVRPDLQIRAEIIGVLQNRKPDAPADGCHVGLLEHQLTNLLPMRT